MQTCCPERSNRRAKRIWTFCWAFIPCITLSALAGAPFNNADFEQGTFTNWPRHEHWSLRAGLATEGYGTADPELVGCYSAATPDDRAAFAQYYTGQRPARYPARLVSAEFQITQPFLIFLLGGDLADARNQVGVDLNADDVADVRLEAEQWQRARRLGAAPAVLSLDLREHVGKPARFVATVVSGSLGLDRLSFADSPAAWIAGGATRQTGDRAQTTVWLTNAHAHAAAVVLRLTVLDFYGRTVAAVEQPMIVPPGGVASAQTTFEVEHGPDYRINAVLSDRSGTPWQVWRTRWTAERTTAARPTLLVDNDWEVAVSDDPTPELPPPDAAWTNESPVKPSGSFEYRRGEWKQHQGRAQVWYRRAFTHAASEIPGGRVFLRIPHGGDGPLAVFVNGQEIGARHLYRFTDHAFDLSRAVRDGRNELVLRFRNPERYLREAPDRFRVPVREYWGIPMGVFGHVYLETRPDVFLDHVLIDPSLQSRTLTLRAVLRNAAAGSLRALVRAGVFDADGRERLRFDAVPVEVPAAGTAAVRLARRWTHPVLWSPAVPQLLRLRIEVAAGDQVDVTDTRFGFREFSTRGRDLLLNGDRLTIFDTTAFAPETFRFHQHVHGMNATRSPFVSLHSAWTADEQGVLLRVVNEDIYPPKVKDISPIYWRQFVEEYQLARVRYFYNHPCIWGWVVGNELGGSGYLREPFVDTFKPLFMQLTADIQKLDPMRSATSDGDLSLFGVSRLWNAHYPHEYALSHGMPNRAYFLQAGDPLMDWFPHPPYDGKAPVFLGEAFSGGNLGPDWLAPFGGDRVYDPLGLADAWSEWCLLRQRAYRDQHILGYEPFEPFNMLVRDFRPVDLYPVTYGQRFYSGTRLRRTIRIFNAFLERKDLVLHWELEGLRSGQIPVRLPPGGTRDIVLACPLPAVAERRDGRFALRLTERDRPLPRCGTWEGPYTIFPRPTLAGTAAVDGLEPETQRALRALGLKLTPVNAGDAWERAEVLISSGAIFTNRPAAVWAWIRRGGWMVLLDQPTDLPVLPLRLNKFADTRAHIIAPDHPVLAGLQTADFSFWGADNWVSRAAYVKPTAGAFRVLAECGDELGLRMTPLVEWRTGRGGILFCSLLLGAKFYSEPAAGVLLANLVRTATVPRTSAPLRIGTLLSDELTAHLQSAGWRIEDLCGADAPRLADYDILWVDVGLATAEPAALRVFAENGGTLILSRFDPRSAERYQEVVPFKFRLTEAPRDTVQGGALKRAVGHPLMAGVSDYDLFWKRGSYLRGGPKMRLTAVPVEFEISPARDVTEVTVILSPGAMLESPLGRGRLLLDQVRWMEAGATEQRAQRVLHAWLNNLDVVCEGAGAGDSQREWIPLTLPTNTLIGPGMLPAVDARIAQLPRGRVLLGTAEFTLAADRPALLMLGAPTTAPQLPRAVTVTVQAAADRIWFWHAAAHGFIDHDHGKVVLEYRLRLRRGTQEWLETVPVRYGQETYEYLGKQPGTLENAAQVTLAEETGLSTYVLKWENLHPDAVLDSLELAAVDGKVTPLILGITLERKQRAAPLTQRRRSGPWSVAASGERFTQITETGRVWAVLGPFENKPPPRGGFDAVFPPEREINLAAKYTGKDGVPIEWMRFIQPESRKFAPDIRYTLDDLGLLPFKPDADREHWTAYAFTRVKSLRPQKAIVAFGSDDGGKLWVNGRLVFEKWAQRGAMLGEDLVVVELNEGWNPILVKIVNTFGTGAFAFDIKPFSAEVVTQWQAQWQSLAPQPSLPLEYDAYAGIGSSPPPPSAVAGLLTVCLEGRRWTLDGEVRPPGAARIEPDAVWLDFSKTPGAGLSVSIPQKGRAFPQGRCELGFCVPQGGAATKLTLLARNDGGANAGDISIDLVGGTPSVVYGGTGTVSRPYQRLLLNLDRLRGYEPVEIPIAGGLAEDAWHQLRVTWGSANQPPGFRVWLDGQEVYSLPDYTGPAFAAQSPLGLASDVQRKGQGALAIRGALLSDEAAEP